MNSSHQRGQFDDAGVPYASRTAVRGVGGTMAEQQLGCVVMIACSSAAHELGHPDAASRSVCADRPGSRASPRARTTRTGSPSAARPSRMTNSRSRGDRLELKRSTSPSADQALARSARTGPNGAGRSPSPRGPGAARRSCWPRHGCGRHGFPPVVGRVGARVHCFAAAHSMIAMAIALEAAVAADAPGRRARAMRLEAGQRSQRACLRPARPARRPRAGPNG